MKPPFKNHLAISHYQFSMTNEESEKKLIIGH